MQITPNEVVGANVDGIDVATLDDAGFAALERALLQHQLLAVHDQCLTPESFIAFVRQFGPIDLHVLDQYWMDGHPEVYVISNIVENGRPIGNAREGFGWHSDLNYFSNPTAVTVLYALEVPPEGGDTMFADAALAYSALTAEHRESLRKLTVRHSYQLLHASRPWLKLMTPAQVARTPDVFHPLVRRHPAIDREGLYLGDWASVRLQLPDEAEARAAQERLLAHMVQPEFRQVHRWRAGDLVLWDNRTLMHTATEYDRERYRRHIWRSSVRGEVPLGAFDRSSAIDVAGRA